jgi:peptidoglycan/LPS O-acetylase OafA/YrhL
MAFLIQAAVPHRADVLARRPILLLADPTIHRHCVASGDDRSDLHQHLEPGADVDRAGRLDRGARRLERQRRIRFLRPVPVLALLIRTMRRAVLFFALSLLAACAANTFMRPALAGSFGEVAVKIFLYFWFPNQLPVFALGTILFFAIRPGLEGFPGRMTRFARRRGTWIILACMSVVPFVAGKPFPQSLPFAPPLYVPLFLVASGLFMVAVSCMAARPDSVFVNAPIRALGKVSFSAYLFHFALLRVLPPWLPKPLGAAATSWMAILSFVALWMAVVTATFALSFVTYRLVEKPMIKAGNRLLARRNTAAAPLPLGVQH